MSYVRAAPEFHLIYDTDSGVLATEREDAILYSLDGVAAQVDELDKIVTDMMNQLGPTSALLSMFPGREKASYYAGIITNAFYGAVVGFIFVFVALLVILARGGI